MGYTVLVVDDSAAMRAVIQKIVKMSGFEVETFLQAGNGIEALDVLAEQKVDLVLSDINMPTMDGMQLLKKIKVDEVIEALPVVMVSTEGSLERQEEAKNMGADGYLKKPFAPEDVRELLEGIMEDAS